MLLAVWFLAGGIAIHLEHGQFVVTGMEDAPAVAPAEAARLFQVFVDAGGTVPPVTGSYRIENGRLVFQPAFPLQAGVTYRAVVRHAGQAVERTFHIPKAEAVSTTRVQAVYPSANLLPENLLKLYLHFSAPMSRGEAYGHITLLEESGRRVELAFLEIQEELWDPAGTRLTVFFDPGRIKRGLLPNEEVGTPLREGGRYRLQIDRRWRDAGGLPLADAFSRSFAVGAADREPPDPQQWRVTAPRSGTREALVVEFPEPMDRGLMERLMEVATENGTPVAGQTAIEGDETRWRFVPEQAWRAGVYGLRVDKRLEDLAGNSIGKVFDVDVFDRVEARAQPETIVIPLTVRD